LEPEKRNKVYEERSAKAGASPVSAQVTVKAVPPGTDAPAAGAVNLTSADTSGRTAASKWKAEKCMTVALLWFSLFAKPVHENE
tara:strand:- start:57 stop:308 length:252 start_codon:yes stop_codon:yes gene_type:complete